MSRQALLPQRLVRNNVAYPSTYFALILPVSANTTSPEKKPLGEISSQSAKLGGEEQHTLLD
eukprot:852924-Heterocapsa_arctica.AAC.1